MDGTTLSSAGAIPGTNVGLGYQTVGFPDINGDGKADKVIEHTASGYQVAFLMNGLTMTSAGGLPGAAAGYTTMGFPDLDGDGKDDKVIQRDSDGNSVAFLLNGLSAASSSSIAGTDTAGGWTLKGFPDIDGDGKADQVLVHSDGRTYGYVMNGLSLSSDGALNATPAGYTQADWSDRWLP